MTRTPEPLTILNISKGADTGAWGYRMTEAFRRYTDWPFHSMYAPNAFLYIDYPVDMRWDGREAQRLYDEADVVHLHNGFSTAKVFERGKRPKPALVTFHGTAYRQNPRAYLQAMRQRNAVGTVSTLDLYLTSPDELVWVPSPYDLEWLRGLRRLLDGQRPLPGRPRRELTGA